MEIETFLKYVYIHFQTGFVSGVQSKNNIEFFHCGLHVFVQFFLDLSAQRKIQSSLDASVQKILHIS